MFLQCFEIIQVGSALSFIAVVWWSKGAGGVVLEKKKILSFHLNV